MYKHKSTYIYNHISCLSLLLIFKCIYHISTWLVAFRVGREEHLADQGVVQRLLDVCGFVHQGVAMCVWLLPLRAHNQWFLIDQLIETISHECRLSSFPPLIEAMREREKKAWKNRRCFVCATKKTSGIDTWINPGIWRDLSLPHQHFRCSSVSVFYICVWDFSISVLLTLSLSLHPFLSSSCLSMYLNILFSMHMCLSVVWECVLKSEKTRASVHVQGNFWYQKCRVSLSLSFSLSHTHIHTHTHTHTHLLVLSLFSKLDFHGEKSGSDTPKAQHMMRRRARPNLWSTLHTLWGFVAVPVGKGPLSSRLLQVPGHPRDHYRSTWAHSKPSSFHASFRASKSQVKAYADVWTL